MFDGQSPVARQARMRMLGSYGMALGGMMQPGQHVASQDCGPGRSISKAERAKRNIRKNIAKQSKKRNRRR